MQAKTYIFIIMNNKDCSSRDVFICSSNKDYFDENYNINPDSGLAKILEAFKVADISYWTAWKDIIPGEDYATKIIQHIKTCKIFVFFSSKSACESEWIPKEIACALMCKKLIIPVLLDDSPFADSIMLRVIDKPTIEYYRDPIIGASNLVSFIKTHLAEMETYY